MKTHLELQKTVLYYIKCFIMKANKILTKMYLEMCFRKEKKHFVEWGEHFLSILTLTKKK